VIRLDAVHISHELDVTRASIRRKERKLDVMATLRPAIAEVVRQDLRALRIREARLRSTLSALRKV
jgi:hypothetical protein